MKRIKNRTRAIIGIDPAEAGDSGLSLWVRGKYVDSIFGNVWESGFSQSVFSLWEDWVCTQDELLVYHELPPGHGHRVACSLSRGTGMWLAMFQGMGLKKLNCKGVAIRSWKKAIYGCVPKEDSKTRALDKVKEMDIKVVVDHNEAEAILIGQYGVWRREEEGTRCGIGISKKASKPRHGHRKEA